MSRPWRDGDRVVDLYGIEWEIVSCSSQMCVLRNGEDEISEEIGTLMSLGFRLSEVPSE